MDVQEAIKNAPLFAQLSKKDIKQLAATLNQRSFPAGTVIIEKGKPGVGFFVIASGSATVTVGGNQQRVLKAGDHFGEVALIDDGPRMAEVTAETDLECYALGGLAVPALRAGPPRRGVGAHGVLGQADRARLRGRPPGLIPGAHGGPRMWGPGMPQRTGCDAGVETWGSAGLMDDTGATDRVVAGSMTRTRAR